MLDNDRLEDAIMKYQAKLLADEDFREMSPLLGEEKGV